MNYMNVEDIQYFFEYKFLGYWRAMEFYSPQ